MKEITVIGSDAVVVSSPTLAPFGATDHIITGPEEMSVSDGYHTFDELYDHRITLYIALCKALLRDANTAEFHGDDRPIYYRNGLIWRSRLHSDGTFFENQFVMGIRNDPEYQITYHIPLARWDETNFAFTLEKAPEWDGHTSDDVLKRLKLL